MPRLHPVPASPSRFVLSWDAATRATDAIARLTITILFTAGIAAHAVVFLALPVGILYDIRRMVAKSMDVARATVAHSRATVQAIGCHPALPPVGYHAAASAYVATVAGNAATSESVINRTEAGLMGLFGDGFTAAVAALTPSHWGMCVDAAIEIADSERVMWLPIGGEMVATAIGRTFAAGVAAFGPVTTLVASMAASFWIFPSLSASALMLDSTGLDVSPRSADGTRSQCQATVTAAVPTTLTKGWGWKLMSRIAGKGQTRRDPDDKDQVRPSVRGGKNAPEERLASADGQASGGDGDGGSCCGGRRGRGRTASFPVGRGDANSGGSGGHHDAVVANHGEKFRPVADNRWDVKDGGADRDFHDDDWESYNDDDAAADDTDYLAAAAAASNDDDDDDDVVGDDGEYAADDSDFPAEGDDWDEHLGDDWDACGEWEAQHSVDRTAADWRRRHAGGVDHRRCTDDDVGTIPSDGEAVGSDARRRADTAATATDSAADSAADDAIAGSCPAADVPPPLAAAPTQEGSSNRWRRRG
ncbi:hypothetical protein MMPV_008367 [Pyropia vietnamensis]